MLEYYSIKWTKETRSDSVYMFICVCVCARACVCLLVKRLTQICVYTHNLSHLFFIIYNN